MNDAFLHGDAAQRKQAPMAEGLLFYFPDALAAVANLSKIGNDQHNPGQPMHHARGKSNDHADCIMRHLAHAGQLDKDGVRETAKVAWRALALLQLELEAAHGLPPPRNAKLPPVLTTHGVFGICDLVTNAPVNSLIDPESVLRTAR